MSNPMSGTEDHPNGTLCHGPGDPHARGFRGAIMRAYFPSRAALAPCAECDRQVERWWRDFKQQPVIG